MTPNLAWVNVDLNVYNYNCNYIITVNIWFLFRCHALTGLCTCNAGWEGQICNKKHGMHFTTIESTICTSHFKQKILSIIIITAWKVSVFGVIHVRIFPHSNWIREVSLRIQSEYGKIRTRITPNTDTFHTVYRNHEMSFYVFH